MRRLLLPAAALALVLIAAPVVARPGHDGPPAAGHESATETGVETSQSGTVHGQDQKLKHAGRGSGQQGEKPGTAVPCPTDGTHGRYVSCVAHGGQAVGGATAQSAGRNHGSVVRE